VKRVNLQQARANCDTGTTEHGECGKKPHVLAQFGERRLRGRPDAPRGMEVASDAHPVRGQRSRRTRTRRPQTLGSRRPLLIRGTFPTPDIHRHARRHPGLTPGPAPRRARKAATNWPPRLPSPTRRSLNSMTVSCQHRPTPRQCRRALPAAQATAGNVPFPRPTSSVRATPRAAALATPPPPRRPAPPRHVTSRCQAAPRRTGSVGITQDTPDVGVFDDNYSHMSVTSMVPRRGRPVSRPDSPSYPASLEDP
jgi:hypothetical protein